MENKFKKVHSNKDIIVSSIITLIGIALIFANLYLGIVTIVVGLLLFIFYKSGYKYDNQGVVLCKKNKEISKKCYNSVLEFLNGKSERLEMIPGNEGGTLMLEVWYNKPESVAYVQLYEYQELCFNKINELVELQSSNAQKLIEQL